MLALKNKQKFKHLSDGSDVFFSVDGRVIARVTGEQLEKFQALRLVVKRVFGKAVEPSFESVIVDDRPIQFIADRLKVQQREAGVRHDLIDAVFALGGEDDLVRLLARVHALQAFIGTPDGANLLAGYKRAANILKKEAPSAPSLLREFRVGLLPAVQDQSGGLVDPKLGRGEGERGAAEPALSTAEHPHPTLSLKGEGSNGVLSYTPEPAEAALVAALDAAEPAAAAAVALEDFEGAMAALATLRAPIDAFFETVIVNDPDQDKRAARLAMLEKVRNAVHSVADFSKIEG